MSKSEQWLNQIRCDHRSGAVALTLKAGEALKCRLDELKGPEELEPEFAAFAERLIEAQPAMASIRNLAVEAMQALPEADRDELRKLIDSFVDKLKTSTPAIARHALKLIPGDARVITVSYSSTVLEALKQADGDGSRLVVICPESRPLNEGLALARKLAKSGIETVVCADAMAPSLVHGCNLALVGGDGLAPEGLVNKIGTYAVALAAREVQIPLAALIGTQKFLDRFDARWIPTMDPGELLPEDVGHLQVINKYFELAPFELISHVVTEGGVFTREGVRELLP